MAEFGLAMKAADLAVTPGILMASTLEQARALWQRRAQVATGPMYAVNAANPAAHIPTGRITWNLTAWNNKGKIEIHFTCPRNTMLNVNYENPHGKKRHNQLWNGDYARGTITLYRKEKGQYEKVDDFDGEMGGCEYGEYDQ